MSGAVFEMWNCSFVKNYRPDLDLRDIEAQGGRSEALPVLFHHSLKGFMYSSSLESAIYRLYCFRPKLTSHRNCNGISYAPQDLATLVGNASPV